MFSKNAVVCRRDGFNNLLFRLVYITESKLRGIWFDYISDKYNDRYLSHRILDSFPLTLNWKIKWLKPVSLDPRDEGPG